MPLNKEKAEKKMKGKGDLFDVKEGNNHIRVLPPEMEYLEEEADDISFEFLVHWGIGPEGSPPVCCPRTLDNHNRCPICDKVRKLRRNPANEALVSRIRAKKRFLFNIIDLNDIEKGVQRMETGPMIHDGIVKWAVDPRYTEDGDLLDPKCGRSLILEKIPGAKTKSKRIQYEVSPDPKSTDITKLLPEDWKDKVEQLRESVLVPPDENDLRTLVNEFLEDGDGSDSEPTPPKNSRRRKVDREPEPTEEKEEKEESKDAMACFGKSYSSKKSECRSCDDKSECINEYVENL